MSSYKETTEQVVQENAIVNAEVEDENEKWRRVSLLLLIMQYLDPEDIKGNLAARSVCRDGRLRTEHGKTWIQYVLFRLEDRSNEPQNKSLSPLTLSERVRMEPPFAPNLTIDKPNDLSFIMTYHSVFFFMCTGKEPVNLIAHTHHYDNLQVGVGSTRRSLMETIKIYMIYYIFAYTDKGPEKISNEELIRCLSMVEVNAFFFRLGALPKLDRNGQLKRDAMEPSKAELEIVMAHVKKRIAKLKIKNTLIFKTSQRKGFPLCRIS